VARRLTRRQIKQDELLTLFDRGMAWMGGNWRQAAAVIGGVAAVALLWWGITAYLSARSGGASKAMAVALDTYTAPVGVAAPADAKVKFTTDTERLAASEKAFESIRSKYRFSPQAKLAGLYLAHIQADRGDATGAIRLLAELAAKRSDDPVVRLATLDLMRMRAGKGEAAQVARELEAMVAGTDIRLPRDLALYELARVNERDHKNDEAARLYRKLVQDFPESPYRAPAQQRLTSLS